MTSSALPKPIAFQKASIVAGSDLSVIEDGYVLVDDGTIVDVGPGPAPVQCETVDLAGYALVPAFINAHTHLADSALKEVGFGLDEESLLMPPDGLKHRMLNALPRETLVEAMRASIRLMLRTGTVAFSDFREQGIAGVAALDEASQGLPITSVTMARFATPPPHPEDEFRRNDATLPPEYLEELEALLAAAPGFSFVTANDTTDAGLRQAAELARARGRRVAVHVAENEQYRAISVARTARSDVDRAIENLQPDFVVHMTTANDAELDIVAAARTPVVVCGRVQAALGNGVPPIVEFDRRGIPVAFATDNAMLASPNLLDELKYMSRVTRATTRNPSLPTPRDLIAGVTTVAAETLKLDDRLGSIECGKAASFIVFDLRSDNLNPTRDLLASIVTRADATDIAAVVNHGFVVAGAMPVREHVSPLPSLNGGMPAG